MKSQVITQHFAFLILYNRFLTFERSHNNQGESIDDVYQEVLEKLWARDEARLAPKRKNQSVVAFNPELHKSWRPPGWYAFIHLSTPSDNCIQIFQTPVCSSIGS